MPAISETCPRQPIPGGERMRVMSGEWPEIASPKTSEVSRDLESLPVSLHSLHGQRVAIRLGPFFWSNACVYPPCSARWQ